VNYAVYGVSKSTDGRGVYGFANATTGATYGVFGRSDSPAGVGVYGEGVATSGVNQGVVGISYSTEGRGVSGIAAAATGISYGVFGTANSPQGFAGYFVGRVSTNSLEIRGGSDLSESFDIQGPDENVRPAPGMVVCIDPARPGDLKVSSRAYDRAVAGIISGAGGVNPGMLMGQEGSVANGDTPVALTGRVYCQVDASKAPVRPGDLLTTSEIPGHAMKVLDYEKAQGAILGKAMTSLDSGRGLVLVLVTLQ
jgi:hypothetical protein